MTSCANCHQSATLKCSACSAHVPPHEVAWYCSKACQKKQWTKHKTACKNACFWSRVRNFVTHPEIFSVRAIGLEMGIDLQIYGNMQWYLDRVRPEVRPQYMNSNALLKAEVIQAVRDVMAKHKSVEAYKAWWSAHVPQELKNKIAAGNEHEVPFDCRSVFEVDELEDGNDIKQGFRFYPQDYEQLSFDLYREMFGNQQVCVTDPFKTRSIPLDEIIIPEGGFGFCP